MAHKIQTQSEKNWESLLTEIETIENFVDSLDVDISKIRISINNLSVAFSALTRLLIEKKLITKNEIQKESDKIIEEYSKQAKEIVEKMKKTKKNDIYNDIMNSDMEGHA